MMFPPRIPIARLASTNADSRSESVVALTMRNIAGHEKMAMMTITRLRPGVSVPATQPCGVERAGARDADRKQQQRHGEHHV